jgi:aspartyl-tRNA(Asn)/glutamyl-tRNA(Gln) amidotransferase subunit B
MHKKDEIKEHYSAPLARGETGDFEIVIGLEVHAQIISNLKLFSDASVSSNQLPNRNVALLDLGMPGALPVINAHCIDQAIKTGLGINGEVNTVSIFDRKNYFYPDLPLGYQISQFYYPIISNGHLDIDLDDEHGNRFTKRINITRLHLEQDAGKSIHDLHPNFTCLDFNRAGVALMEIVSEPDMRSAKEAVAYVKKLRGILRYLETCDADMEKGNLRIDANISVHKLDEPFGTRAEIKNVNSLRFLREAIDYEVKRQIEIIESGGKVIQETRLFDSVKGVTRSMRSKEDANDYRYFQDPDLKPLVLSKERIDYVRSTLVELIDRKRDRFIHDFGLSFYDADILVQEKETADFYENLLRASTHPEKQKTAKLLSNWIISELFGLMNKNGITALKDIPFEPYYLIELVDLILDSTLSGKMAKDIFLLMFERNESPKNLVKESGLCQISDIKILEEGIDEIIKQHPKQIQDFKNGKVQLFGFFIGQAMKVFKGKANPELLNELVKKKLG